MLSSSKFEVTYITLEPLDETSVKKRLAYPIKHHQEAYYTTKIVDEAPKEKPKNIIRELIVQIDRETMPTKTKTKKPKLKIEELDKKLEEILEEEVIQ